MARKASLIVVLAWFAKQNSGHITCLMLNGVILLKGLISLTTAPRGLGCEIKAGEYFPGVEFGL